MDTKDKLPPLGHTDPGRSECRNPPASLSSDCECFIVENKGVACRKYRGEETISRGFLHHRPRWEKPCHDVRRGFQR
jgi:hypothetical protein